MPAPRSFAAARFALELDGVQCGFVRSVEGGAVKADVVKEPAAGGFVKKHLGPPDVEPVGESSAKSWFDWQRTFVVEGKTDDQQEKSGRVVLLGANLQDVLGEIHFFNLGLFHLADAKEQPTDAVKRVVADLYCERMELALGP